jgi:protein TonB
MMEGAFYQQKKTSPTALAVVVLMHGAALTALALTKSEVFTRDKPPPTTVDLIEEQKPPPEVPPEPVKTEAPPPPSVITRTPPIVEMPPRPVIAQSEPLPPLPTTVFPTPGPAPVARIEPPAPAPPAAKTVEPARAKANLASYVSDEDYPSTAIRNEEQGTTRFRLGVGPDGKVKECTVTSSSGSPALDSTTCKLMRQRARFTPATGSDGKPTSDTVTNAIRWVLPTD